MGPHGPRAGTGAIPLHALALPRVNPQPNACRMPSLSHQTSTVCPGPWQCFSTMGGGGCSLGRAGHDQKPTRKDGGMEGGREECCLAAVQTNRPAKSIPFSWVLIASKEPKILPAVPRAAQLPQTWLLQHDSLQGPAAPLLAAAVTGPPAPLGRGRRFGNAANNGVTLSH